MDCVPKMMVIVKQGGSDWDLQLADLSRPGPLRSVAKTQRSGKVDAASTMP